MQKTRREFLTLLRNGIPLAFLNNFLPRAFLLGDLFSATAFAAGRENTEPHFFFLIETSGGLDATLGLDPVMNAKGLDQKDVYLEKTELIKSVGDLHFGPSALALAPHAANIAVLNGVRMHRASGHERCSAYISSGSTGTTPNIAVELASTCGAGPVGVIVNDRIETGSRTVLLKQSSEFLNEGFGEQTSRILDQVETVPSARLTDSPLVRIKTSLEKSRPEVAKLTEYIKEMRKKVEKPEAYHVIGASFLEGAARQARIVLRDRYRELDSHSSHPGNHLAAQTVVWDKVAEIFSFFKSIPFQNGSLFDSTTFMVVSEFSRIPYLNQGQGKDHNEKTNSVLLAGKNISGGKTFGASKVFSHLETKDGIPAHLGLAYDYILGRTCEHRDGALFIYPENVVQTIAQVFGNPDDFSSSNKNYPRIPGLARV